MTQTQAPKPEYVGKTKPPLRGLRRLYHRMVGSKTVRLSGVRVHAVAPYAAADIRSHLYKGTYEVEERLFVSEKLRPGDRVLEIGCGIGLVSLLATRICGPGHVTSFEANPAMEDAIRANYALNGLEPDLRMQAVTADGRTLEFFQQDTILSSSLYESDLGGRAISVSSVGINDALADLSPSVIIMDVEGAEDEILPVADLSGVRAVIAEMHHHILGEDRVYELADLMALKGLPLRATRHKTFLFAR